MKNKALYPAVAIIMLLSNVYAEQQSENTPAVVASQEEALGQTAAPWLNIALERILTYDKLASVLEKVNDKITAEAAVAETQSIIELLKELNKKEMALAVPTEEVAAYVEAQLLDTDIADLSERVITKVIELLAQTDPPCHGSRELSNALYAFSEMIMATE